MTNNKPISIGYFSPGWPAEAFCNGIATAIGTLTPSLRAMGHQVTIIAGKVVDGTPDVAVYDLDQACKRLAAAARPATWLGYRVAPHLTVTLVWRRSLLATARRAVGECGIQILEVEETFGNALWISRGVSIPVCVRLHGPWFLNGPAQGCPEDDAFRRRVRLEGKAIRAASAITAVSRDVLERTRAFYDIALPEAEVIPGTTPAVPAAERWRLEDCDPRAILFVGRFDRHKGGDLVIEAFGRVRKEIPEAHLWFVGMDSGFLAGNGQTWKIEDFVRDRLPGALETGQVRWFGFQPLAELNRLRRRALVTVVCSRYETLSSATVEAMTMGCPTVAARIGGMAETIEDGVDGLLHRAEDPEDLAGKICALMNDPVRAAQLGRQAAATRECRFHPDIIARRFAEFYHDVIHKRRRCPQDAGACPETG